MDSVTPGYEISERRRKLNELTSPRPFLTVSFGDENGDERTTRARLLLDTGASTSVLSSRLVDQIIAVHGRDAVQREASSLHLAGIGQESPVDNQGIVTVGATLGAASLDDFSWVQVNEDHLGDMQGLIGMNLIRKQKLSLVWDDNDQLKVRMKVGSGKSEAMKAQLMTTQAKEKERRSLRPTSQPNQPVTARIASTVMLQPKSTQEVTVVLEGQQGDLEGVKGKEVVLQVDPALEAVKIQAPSTGRVTRNAVLIMSLLYIGSYPFVLSAGSRAGLVQKVDDLEVEPEVIDYTKQALEKVSRYESVRLDGCLHEIPYPKFILTNPAGISLLGQDFCRMSPYAGWTDPRPGFFMVNTNTALLIPGKKGGWSAVTQQCIDEFATKRPKWTKSQKVAVVHTDGAELCFQVLQLLCRLSKHFTVVLKLRAEMESRNICFSCKASSFLYAYERLVSANFLDVQIVYLTAPAQLPSYWHTSVQAPHKRTLFKMHGINVESVRFSWRGLRVFIHPPTARVSNEKALETVIVSLMSQLKYLSPAAKVSHWSNSTEKGMICQRLSGILSRVVTPLKWVPDRRAPILETAHSAPRDLKHRTVQLLIPHCACYYCQARSIHSDSLLHGDSMTHLKTWKNWPQLSTHEAIKREDVASAEAKPSVVDRAQMLAQVCLVQHQEDWKRQNETMSEQGLDLKETDVDERMKAKVLQKLFLPWELQRPPFRTKEQKSAVLAALDGQWMNHSAEELDTPINQFPDSEEIKLADGSMMRKKQVDPADYERLYDMERKNAPLEYPFVRYILNKFSKTTISYAKSDRTRLKTGKIHLRVKPGFESKLPSVRATPIPRPLLEVAHSYIRSLEVDQIIGVCHSPRALSRAKILFKNTQSRHQFEEIMAASANQDWQVTKEKLKKVKLRLVLALTRLNACLEDDDMVYGVTYLKDIFTSLILARDSEASCLSTLDLKDAFPSLGLDSHSASLCGFEIDGFGCYLQFLNLAAGLKNAPGILSRTITRGLRPECLVTCVVHLDDVAVNTKKGVRLRQISTLNRKTLPRITMAERKNYQARLEAGEAGPMVQTSEKERDLLELMSHMETLEHVLEDLTELRALISVDKMCILSQNQTQLVLGLAISRHGLEISSDRKAALTAQTPFPATREALRSKIGQLTWVLPFVENASSYMSVLHRLVHSKEYRPTAVEITAYRILQSKIEMAPCLSFVDVHLPVYSCSDSSQICFSGVIFQKYPDGNIRLLKMVSGTHPAQTRKLHASVLEAIGIVKTLEAARTLAIGCTELRLLTDCIALEHCYKASLGKLSSRPTRILMRLLELRPTFVISWIPQDTPILNLCDNLSRGFYRIFNSVRHPKTSRADTTQPLVTQERLPDGTVLKMEDLLALFEDQVTQLPPEKVVDMKEGEATSFNLGLLSSSIPSYDDMWQENSGDMLQLGALDSKGKNTVKGGNHLVGGISIARIVECQSKNEGMAEKVRHLKELSEKEKRATKSLKKYTLLRGVILARRGVVLSRPTPLICLTLELCVWVLGELEQMFHAGPEKLVQIFKRHYCFPEGNVLHIAKHLKAACSICIRIEPSYSARNLTMGALPKSRSVHYQWSIDHAFLSPVKIRSKNYVGFLLAVDSYSRFLMLGAVTSTAASETIRVLSNFFEISQAIPYRISSDSHSALTKNKQLQEFLFEKGVQKVNQTLPYRSHAFAVEQKVSMAKRCIRQLTLSTGKTWVSLLSACAAILNTTITEYPVYDERKRRYGKVFCSPIEVAGFASPSHSATFSFLLQGISQQMAHEMIQTARKDIQAANEQLRLLRRHEQNNASQLFHKGDLCVRFDHTFQKNIPSCTRFGKTIYKIVELKGYQATLSPLGKSTTVSVHVKDLKLLHQSSILKLLPTHLQSSFVCDPLSLNEIGMPLNEKQKRVKAVSEATQTLWQHRDWFPAWSESGSRSSSTAQSSSSDVCSSTRAVTQRRAMIEQVEQPLTDRPGRAPSRFVWASDEPTNTRGKVEQAKSFWRDWLPAQRAKEKNVRSRQASKSPPPPPAQEGRRDAAAPEQRTSSSQPAASSSQPAATQRRTSQPGQTQSSEPDRASQPMEGRTTGARKKTGPPTAVQRGEGNQICADDDEFMDQERKKRKKRKEISEAEEQFWRSIPEEMSSEEGPPIRQQRKTRLPKKLQDYVLE